MTAYRFRQNQKGNKIPNFLHITLAIGILNDRKNVTKIMEICTHRWNEKASYSICENKCLEDSSPLIRLQGTIFLSFKRDLLFIGNKFALTWGFFVYFQRLQSFALQNYYVSMEPHDHSLQQPHFCSLNPFKSHLLKVQFYYYRI